MGYEEIDDLVSASETVSTDSSGKHGKYFHVSVPNYYGAATTTAAYDLNGILTAASARSSFVRIGAPPAPIETSWVDDPGANLVRMAYIIGPAGKERDAAVTSRFTNEFLDAAKTKKNPEYHADMLPYAPEDADVVICAPFIDDSRLRGVGNQNPDGSNGHGLDAAGRKAISDKLQSNVGWRDHADGNRITTTAGDKIEVIQGNYKLIVLGRQTDPSQAMGWEATGNNVQDFAGATMPGASVTVTWIKEAYLDPSDEVAAQKTIDDLIAAADADQKRIDVITGLLTGITSSLVHASSVRHGGAKSPRDTLLAEERTLKAEKATLTAALDEINARTLQAARDALKDAQDFNAGYQGGAWLLQNSTERVYQYSRNAGNFKEENWGDLWETYVGSENPARVGKKDADGTTGHPPNHYKRESTTPLDEPMPSTSSVGLPRGNPHIIEKTWATKIESYTGSANWYVPEIHEETYVDSKYEETHCSGTITSKSYAKATKEETHVTENADAKKFAGSITEVTAAGAIATTTSAAVIVENTNAGAHVELHLGALHSNIEIGGVIDLFLGGKIDIDISKTLEVTLIEHKEFKTKKQKAALQAQETALTRVVTTLDSDTKTLTETRRALRQTIQALQLSLGL